jgi:hypothetical protein
MFKNLSFKIFLFLSTLSLSVGAGGTVATGYSNGVYLPKSDDVITWSAYGGSLTPVLRDVVALATATVDAETLAFRLLHEMHPETSEQHVYFSFKPGPPDPQCLDDVPGGCQLGLHQCFDWDVDGPYRLCKQSRIFIYTSNIETGGPLAERLHNIIRHEWVHVLGFRDGVGGPTSNGGNPFTPCQLAQMSLYASDPAAEGWTVTTPMECE